MRIHINTLLWSQLIKVDNVVLRCHCNPNIKFNIQSELHISTMTSYREAMKPSINTDGTNEFLGVDFP